MGIEHNQFSLLKSVPIQRVLVNLLLSPIISLANGPTLTAGMFENISLSTPEMLQRAGYAVETHAVTTEDGYVLEMHRIPRSMTGQQPTRNHPVFVHHGIIGSSADWIFGGPSKSLPMQLSDSGYDVWLANCRGNTYSTRHVSLSVKSAAFWDFSMHEIGKYDLPAAIDYVLAKTQSTQLHYVGFSMGTTVFYIMASEHPEYQPKIRSQISLAPVAYLGNTRSAMKYFAPHAKTLNKIFQMMTKGRLLPHSKLYAFLGSTICKGGITQKFICQKYIIFSVCGSDPHNFDSKLIPLIMGHVPAGTSSKLAEHFAQLIITGAFKQYDYGPTKNMQLYNSTTPPEYNLKSIQVPITLMYGANDILADTIDVMRLKDELPKLMDAIQVGNEYCNHVDILWSTVVKESVNDPVRGILEKTDDRAWRYSGPSCATASGSAAVNGGGGGGSGNGSGSGGGGGSEGGNGSRLSLGPSSTAACQPDTQDNEIRCDGSSSTKATSHLLVNDVGEYDRDQISGLEYLANNLDAVIETALPRVRYDADVALFEREKIVQRILFGNAVDLVKRFEYGIGAARSGVSEVNGKLTNTVTGATRLVETNVNRAADAIGSGAAHASNAVETGVNKVSTAIETGVNNTADVVGAEVARASNVVETSVRKTKDLVSTGVARASNAVETGVRKTKDLVGGEVARASNAVETGVKKVKDLVGDEVVWVGRTVNQGLTDAENMVNRGLATVDRTVQTNVINRLDRMIKGLSKALRFF